MRDEPWLIVDTETDGLYEPIHVVEIAAQKMRGWERDGQPFSILLDHDVPIDPMAQAVHGYSREFLRKNGENPATAHSAFRAYAADLPVVAYNISFDWNRALEPEYARLGLPNAGKRGFCAMTLSRRVITETPNFKLETLKDHFGLNNRRPHVGRNDVETTVALFERVLAPRLYKAGIVGFNAVADFSRRTPVVACQEQIHGVGDPIWFILDLEGNPQGPFHTSAVREFTKFGPAFVWRDGMGEWVETSVLPEFAPRTTRKHTRKSKKAVDLPTIPKSHSPTVSSNAVGPVADTYSGPGGSTSNKVIDQEDQEAERLKWTDQLVGLCKGIIADGVINSAELLMLQQWLITCPVTHIYPMSSLAEIIEDIVADGQVSAEELDHLRLMINVLLETAEMARPQKRQKA